jgi:TM2 domain-containing membrane protein YozV
VGVDNIDNVTVNVNAGAPIAGKEKSPLLAAIGSFLIPGLGQVYNGQGYLKGLLYMVGIFIGSLLLVLPGLAVWVYGIYNAYTVAKKVNMGLMPAKDTSLLGIIGYVVLYFVIVFVITFIVIIFSAVIMAFLVSISESAYSY